MRRAYYEIYIHIIWSTKNREGMIKTNVEDSIYNIVKEKCKKYNIQALAIGNTEDHMHLLLSINPDIKISDFIAEVKGATSHFINHQTAENLYWQDGYGVLSVSKSGLKIVKEYVENQKEKHINTNDIIPLLEKILTD